MAAQAVVSSTDADIGNVIIKALSQAGEPMSAEAIWQQIPKSLRPRKKALFFDELEQAVANGSLWKFAPYRGKAERYSRQPLEQYAKQLILAAMGDKPITESKLKQKISKQLGSPNEQDLQAVLDRLMADGSLCSIEIRKKPQYFSRGTNLSVFFAEAFKAFEKKIDGLTSKLAESGIPREAALRAVGEMIGGWLQRAEAAPASNGSANVAPTAWARELASAAIAEDGSVDDRILEAIAELRDANRSPLVSVAKLRRALELSFADKAAFDRAILALSKQEKVALHRHDYPFSLSVEERDALVTDGQEFFSGIALRQ